jgi:hypothetical protein
MGSVSNMTVEFNGFDYAIHQCCCGRPIGFFDSKLDVGLIVGEFNLVIFDGQGTYTIFQLPELLSQVVPGPRVIRFARLLFYIPYMGFPLHAGIKKSLYEIIYKERIPLLRSFAEDGILSPLSTDCMNLLKIPCVLALSMCIGPEGFEMRIMVVSRP